MNREQITTAVADNTGVNSNDAKSVINNFLEVIGDELGAGSEVNLDVFGTFDVETVDRKRKPRFKAGTELSGKVN